MVPPTPTAEVTLPSSSDLTYAENCNGINRKNNIDAFVQLLPGLKRSDLMYFAEKLFDLFPNGSPEANNLLWKGLQKADRPALSSLQELMRTSLRRDFISDLPTEVVMKIFGYLDYKTLLSCEEVCKSWNNISHQSYYFWKNLFMKDFVSETDVEAEFNKEYAWVKQRLSKLAVPAQIAKVVYKRRTIIARRWKDPTFNPRRITLPSQGDSVITCLQFDDDKIVAGSADNAIYIYDTETGELRSTLEGHTGGVWAMKYSGNTLASGSTDRSVRIWNIKQGKCTHIFKGHVSTVRCMEIIEPQQIGTDDLGRPIMYPDSPLLVTGSRDHTLYVWKFPVTGEDEELPEEPIELEEDKNPYFVRVLRGHTNSVRAVCGYANIVVSSSYDSNARVWDLRTGECLWLLAGHTERIYSCVLDVKRNRCITGSVDNTCFL
ncbi:unnamed protein product [Ambrosiozyma monospora]|uniref:Unnamed protein product n=1 Tax=Ambrosiozyma monospora TaxID=43982 RepID=A0ACB5T3U1_AMBMO|nr:unnamed protein product [Ambrosiozyma monospora]